MHCTRLVIIVLQLNIMRMKMVGKRREKLAAFNRSNILESAYTLFQEKGIAGTTMDDIARHAEYSKTTIYKYFGSKEDLVCHLIFEGVEFFQTKLLEDTEQSKNFADFYARFCQSITTIHEKYPLYYDGIIGAMPFDAHAPVSDIHKKIYISGESVNDIIEEQIIKSVIAQGIKPSDDLAPMIILMRFCLMGIVEKATLKEDYLSYKLGKTKEEFLEFAFGKLYELFIPHGEVSSSTPMAGSAKKTPS